MFALFVVLPVLLGLGVTIHYAVQLGRWLVALLDGTFLYDTACEAEDRAGWTILSGPRVPVGDPPLLVEQQPTLEDYEAIVEDWQRVIDDFHLATTHATVAAERRRRREREEREELPETD